MGWYQGGGSSSAAIAASSAADLQAHCHAHLAGYKVPKRIAIVAASAIPVNPSGKMVKTELRETFAWPTEETSTEAASPPG